MPEIEMKAAGDGATFPADGDLVTLHYVGTLEDGTVFDSSRKRGHPWQFRSGDPGVIKAWNEGIPQMSLGEISVLMCPAADCYGARGAGGVIPPNADLDFEVELVKIN